MSILHYSRNQFAETRIYLLLLLGKGNEIVRDRDDGDSVFCSAAPDPEPAIVDVALAEPV